MKRFLAIAALAVSFSFLAQPSTASATDRHHAHGHHAHGHHSNHYRGGYGYRSGYGGYGRVSPYSYRYHSGYGYGARPYGYGSRYHSHYRSGYSGFGNGVHLDINGVHILGRPHF